MEHPLHQTTYLADYQPPAFTITDVMLHFDLYTDKTIVRSKLKVQRQPTATLADIILQGEGLSLQSIHLDGRQLTTAQYTVDEHQLRILQAPDQFELAIVTLINPQANTALSGLYFASGLFCTQCEPEGFRHITYFLDRPDVMSVYTTTLTADQQLYPVLLSNGNVVERGETTDGRHWATWHDPFKKPCYLFAVVAGNLSVLTDFFVTSSGRRIDLHIYAEQGDTQRCEFAMSALKNAMSWDEQRFGRECDLDNYNIVVVNDFNMGAMENKGLNIFNAKYVLASMETATDQDFVHIQSVIGHEYFHNWTGNRVTCRDWFQLSLKEGLTIFREQEFEADCLSPAVLRIQQAKYLRAVQFAEDSGPMAHPVQPQSYMEINNFYTVTIYDKGGEVARMLQTLVGRAGFRKGMDTYFHDYDGMAVTIEEFVHSMEKANGVDLSQFRLWYHQAGTPELFITPDYNAAKQRYTLTVRQLCPPTPGQIEKQPMLIPVSVALFDAAGQPMDVQLQEDALPSPTQAVLLQVTEATQTFTFVNVPRCPTPSLLRGFSAPVKLHFPYTDEELSLLLVHDNDAFNRWEAMQQMLLTTIQRAAGSYREHLSVTLAPRLVTAFQTLLEQSHTDPWYFAVLLAFPSEKYIAQSMDIIDPFVITRISAQLQQALAIALKDQWLAVYRQHHETTIVDFSAAAMGKRALKNLSLRYLMRADKAYIELAEQQFAEAAVMTDSLAALMALAHEPLHRDAVLNTFYQRWSHQPLLLDTWFAAHAQSHFPGVLQEVDELCRHPQFTWTNPNRVRALFSTLAHENFEYFHVSDGVGYHLLGKAISTLDPLNAHLAARLTEPFTHWRAYVEPYRSQMHQVLTTILQQPGLSKETYEVVSKSLS